MENSAHVRATGRLYAHVPAAGVTGRNLDQGADVLLREPERPSTPAHEAKYRFNSQSPGQRHRHFGVAGDSIPQGPYGKPSDHSTASVPSSMRQLPASAWEAHKREQAEGSYDSRKRQPLGHVPLRNEPQPSSVPGLGVTVPYGKALHAVELDRANQGKQTIFPASSPWSSSQDPSNPHHGMYIKSHGAYAAGEQRQRSYDWDATRVDPKSHAFGSPHSGTSSKSVSADMKAAFRDQETPQSSNAHQQHHEAVQHHHLGRARQLACADRSLPADFTFGSKPSRRQQSGNLLGHAGSAEDVQLTGSDAGLGKSIQEGWKNSEVPNRVFGVPSIRRDVSPPARPSVANSTGYANSATMAQSMQPSKANEAADEFSRLRTAGDVRALLTQNSILMDEREFADVFKRAAVIDKADEKCSLSTFLQQRQA